MSTAPVTHKLLQLAPLPPTLEQALGGLVETHVLARETDPGAFLFQHGSEFTIAATNASVGIGADLMRRLPRLRAVCSLGVGHDAIDLAAAGRAGVVVSNTPDVLTDCVADLAIGLMIDVARGLSCADRHVRRGAWALQGPPAPATRVSGKRLGLLGMGRIAHAVAQRATGFSMDIRYHCRTPRPASGWRHEASLPKLAEWADFLVVACSGGPETRHLVSADVLHSLGCDGFLVNVARGSIVDQNALIAALQAGRLKGAALDVFEDEPRVAPELVALDNVVLAPHIGSSTRETRTAMAELVLDNVRSFLERGELLTPCAVPAS